MTDQLVSDLLITGGTTVATYYSGSVPLGGDFNGAKVALWIHSLNGSIASSDAIIAALEGSNDGINWLTSAEDANLKEVDNDGVAAPQWEVSPVTGVLSYGHLRLRIQIVASSGTATALVSAAIYPYRAA